MHLSVSFLLLFSTSVFAQGFWTQKASLPGQPRVDALYFSIGNSGYIACGGDANFVMMGDVWEYDPVSNAWIQRQNFPGAWRWQGVGFGIGNKGYCGTGEAGNPTAELWEYDPQADTWTQKANYPGTAKKAAAGFSIGGKGYIGSGTSMSLSATSDFWEYDPITNAWAQKANIPGSRYFAFGFSISNKGYIGTGFDSLGNLRSDFVEYDPVQNSWTTKAAFPGSGSSDIDGEHFTIGNCAYVGKGNLFWKYDPLTDQWNSIPSLPASGRIGAIGFSINSTGYIGLGYGNQVCLNDLWSFTDTTAYPITQSPPSELMIPNVFSPNGDGINDAFTIAGDGITMYTFKVYNRWGSPVWGITAKQISWDGHAWDGSQLSDGTYYYTLNDPGTSSSYKGYLTLSRKK
jgi:gliding motility-associated-like protein